MTESLALLRSARRIGLVLAGGSSRCAFQVGVIEALTELEVRPAVLVAVSSGVWNAAAVAAGTEHHLRRYWRAFCRLPAVDLTNLLRERSPFLWTELHRRTFGRYVGGERLRAPGALPLFVGLTRVRDLAPVYLTPRDFADPLQLLLASNYLPPFFTRPPRLNGEVYADGSLADNVPYAKAFAEGCDAVVLVTMKGETDGGMVRNPWETDHRIPSPWRERTLVIRPRQSFALSFVERRWEVLGSIMDLGRQRAREVLLGEAGPVPDVPVRSKPGPSALLFKLLAFTSSQLAGRCGERGPRPRRWRP